MDEKTLIWTTASLAEVSKNTLHKLQANNWDTIHLSLSSIPLLRKQQHGNNSNNNDHSATERRRVDITNSPSHNYPGRELTSCIVQVFQMTNTNSTQTSTPSDQQVFEKKSFSASSVSSSSSANTTDQHSTSKALLSCTENDDVNVAHKNEDENKCGDYIYIHPLLFECLMRAAEEVNVRFMEEDRKEGRIEEAESESTPSKTAGTDTNTNENDDSANVDMSKLNNDQYQNEENIDNCITNDRKNIVADKSNKDSEERHSAPFAEFHAQKQVSLSIVPLIMDTATSAAYIPTFESTANFNTKEEDLTYSESYDDHNHNKDYTNKESFFVWSAEKVEVSALHDLQQAFIDDKKKDSSSLSYNDCIATTIHIQCIYLCKELQCLSLDELQNTLAQSLEGKIIMSGTVAVLSTHPDGYLAIVIVSSITLGAEIINTQNSTTTVECININPNVAYQLGTSKSTVDGENMHGNVDCNYGFAVQISFSSKDGIIMNQKQNESPSDYTASSTMNHDSQQQQQQQRLNQLRHQTLSTQQEKQEELLLSQSNINASEKECPGYESLVLELQQLVAFGLAEGGEKSTTYIARPSGILLSGSAGIGKTRLTSCVSQNMVQIYGSYIHWVSAHDLLLMATWATEEDILETLYPPPSSARQSNTTDLNSLVIIIDDLHLLLNTKDDSDEVVLDPELVIVQNSILQIFDDEFQNKVADGGWNLCPIVGIGQKVVSPSAQNNGMFKIGYFEKQITMLPPTQNQRESILYHMLLEFNVAGNGNKNHHNLDYGLKRRWAEALSPLTVGCVAGDLRQLLADAWTRAYARLMNTNVNDNYDNNYHGPSLKVTNLPSVLLCWNDLREAAINCIPSQLMALDVSKPVFAPGDNDFTNDDNTEKHDQKDKKKEDWKSIHEMSWRGLGGYSEVKRRIYRSVVAPWKRFMQALEQEQQQKQQESFASSLSTSSGMTMLSPPPGVLFHGPSGCGKSLATNSLASSLGFPMIKVKPSDVLDKWLGGSESILRSIFAQARASAPCILFFDEIDAIATNRANDEESSTDVMSRLLSTFLNEMDGISTDRGRHCVLVVACTNRMETLDSALLRPGRLEEHILLSHPTSVADVAEILNTHLKSTPTDTDVDTNDLANLLVSNNLLDDGKRKTIALTGADIEGICREACLRVLRRVQNPSDVRLSKKDFLDAIQASAIGFKQNS